MTRFLVFIILVFVIYYLVRNSLKGRAAREVFQQPNQKEDVVNASLKEISYVFYTAAKDGDTCAVCMALDGKHLLPDHKMLLDIKPPHAGCKSSKGCRCRLVYVTQDEEGSRKIESLLKRFGGMCDRQTIERARAI
jgi:hypothetical protein